MASTARPTFDSRYDQIFPVLEAAEIERLRRFGERRAFGAGERLLVTGQVGPGMFVIERGEVALSQHSVLGGDQHILTYGPRFVSAASMARRSTMAVSYSSRHRSRGREVGALA